MPRASPDIHPLRSLSRSGSTLYAVLMAAPVSARNRASWCPRPFHASSATAERRPATRRTPICTITSKPSICPLGMGRSGSLMASTSRSNQSFMVWVNPPMHGPASTKTNRARARFSPSSAWNAFPDAMHPAMTPVHRLNHVIGFVSCKRRRHLTTVRGASLTPRSCFHATFVASSASWRCCRSDSITSRSCLTSSETSRSSCVAIVGVGGGGGDDDDSL
mmetsp:Transcript_6394/g.14559  ORF Transcript_6394/g.14559 Transcript_6394/m.14559 type:complete len:220 (+) Transcript_6394:530-1189(+)